tara:strand:+ start:300 stop:860 length:561 start_codon:yes stop_codon:yes gene_type:complete
MDFGLLYIIFILIIIGFLYYKSITYPVIYQKSSIDNNTYLVRNESDKQLAANTIAKIRQLSVELISLLHKKYPNKAEVTRLKLKFNPNNIYETNYKQDYTSYSINKGEKIYMCLRNQNNIVDINTLFFVMMHELAHVMTNNWGHNKIFWDNFKFLIDNAVEFNLYKFVNYNQNPVKYCGIKIDSNP